MSRKHLFVLSAVLGLAFVAFLGVPALFTTSDSFLCTLPKASAQDASPCLEQAATISALQVQLQQVSFQATLDSMGFQSTLAAVSSMSSAPVSSGSGSTGATNIVSSAGNGSEFTETFDNNDRGWELTTYDNGSVRISQQRLLVSSKDNLVYARVPGSFGDNFYLEAAVSFVKDPYGSGAGFYAGDSDGNGLHFLVKRDGDKSLNIAIGQQNPGERINWVENKYSGPEFAWAANTPLPIGLEARNGLYSLFINGQSVESIQFKTRTPIVSLIVTKDCCTGGEYYFDNVTARGQR